jgi:cell division protein FtsA
MTAGVTAAHRTSTRGRRGAAPAPGDVVAALDIGTHKVCCLIAVREPVSAAPGLDSPRLKVLGFGHQRSQGIEAGGVADLKLARAAVAAAVAQAEHAAGLRIDRVALSVNCGDPRSRTFNGHVELAQGSVRHSDIARLDSGARSFAARDGDVLLSLNRIAFSLDTTPNVRAPLGLAGRRLDANHHAVTVAPGPLRNLCLLVESCHLEPCVLLPAGYASALASTTESERWAGVVCVDIGAGVTSIAGFADGHFIHAAALPFGGQHSTDELAHATAVPLAQAERIKTLYASLASTAHDEHALVPLVPGLDGGLGDAVIPRARISQIVTGTTRHLLARVRACIDGCGVERLRQAPVVLTGGAADTMGLEAFATAELGRTVRIGVPPRLDGPGGRLSGGVPGPGFSCVIGLALEAASPSAWITGHEPVPAGRRGYLARVEQWLRESF